jgi:hypothetical protein
MPHGTQCLPSRSRGQTAVAVTDSPYKRHLESTSAIRANLTEAVLLGQPQRRNLGMYQILKKNNLERRLSLETPQMNKKMAEVTAAVFNTKKNILRRSQRMDGSDTGVVRNGPTTNCTGWPEKALDYFVCCACSEFHATDFETQLCIPDCTPSWTRLCPYPWGKSVFYTLLDFLLYNVSVYPDCQL